MYLTSSFFNSRAAKTSCRYRKEGLILPFSNRWMDWVSLPMLWARALIVNPRSFLSSRILLHSSIRRYCSFSDNDMQQQYGAISYKKTTDTFINLRYQPRQLRTDI